MPFVPTPGAALAVAHFMLDGQDVEVTQWFVSETGPVSEADVTALGKALQDWYSNVYIEQLPEAVTANYLSIRAQDVENGPGADFPLNGTAGGIVDDPMPNEVTVAVSFRTAHSGPGGRGRNYIPALPRANVTGNLVDNALLTNWLNVYNGLAVAVDGTGFVHCVAHRFSGFTIVDGKKKPTPLTTGITYAVTSYIFSDNVVDAQRRRGPGRGR